ncbi:MAG: hypothetical protein WA194_00555 [Patescibacteria group bacterium]
MVYRDGSFSIVGSLESEDVQGDAFKDLPLGRAEVRSLGDDKYVVYAVRLNDQRTLVLYEPEDVLV